MIRLVRAELMRLRSRRAPVVLSVLTVLVGLFILIGLAVDSSGPPPSADVLAQAREEYDELVELCRVQRPTPCSPDYLADLQVEDFYEDSRFVLGQDSGVPLIAYGVLLVLMSIVVGTTFIGSEWHHGTFGSLLTWEPRRVRVLLSKVAVASGAPAVASFVLLLVFLAGLWLVAVTRGVASAPAGFVPSTLGDVARMALVSGLFATLAVALASLTRSTAASLGILLAYVAVIERFLEAVRPRWRPWLPGNLAAAVFAGEIRIFIPNEFVTVTVPGGVPEIAPREIVITAGRGMVVLSVYAAILVAAAVLDFRRRDVT